MSHLRTIGIGWLLFGVLGTCWLLIDLFRNVSNNSFAGVIGSDCLVLTLCLAAACAGYGLLRRRKWARVLCGVIATLLLLYALSYFMMVGLEFGMVCYAIMWMVVLFSVYSLIATALFGRAS
jgi:lipopolysaccharide export LptBFGC system permease protein LptF